jgi:putative addiction module CopG family antidote
MEVTMTLPALPSDLAQFVSDQIGSGKYASQSEVVFDALRQMRDRERRVEELRGEIAPALDRLERGEGRELNIEEVIGRGMERYRKSEQPS